MAYGISTWDANGVYNNYGIKPVSVISNIPLASGQTSGQWSFNVPAGKKLGYVVGLDAGGQQVGRRIEISGNSIIIHPATTSELGYNYYPASQCELIVYLENA
ncbi:outer membrane protein [Escherichia phage vB_EcoS_W011D]|uniref:Uncharacterized protein n=1 Tax=Escherichia phage vB_EcoS_W011D TaxID=2575323 RepID=A0A4Y5NRA5_9CAUD|nr:outer membrane protein [Escherichia phage vB_EcoS_W011D]QCW18516.1 hypothetical protein vBEcoSW011D_73 [Escherichia phage vB_EcoS_W011D]